MATKKRTPKPTPEQCLTAFRIVRRKLLRYLDRIAAIQTNGGSTMTDVMNDRLIGAEQALKEATQAQNHLDTWLNTEESLIVGHHKQLRPDGCSCGVCRRTVTTS